MERGAASEEELAAVRGAAAEAGGLVTLLQGELDTVKAQVTFAAAHLRRRVTKWLRPPCAKGDARLAPPWTACNAVLWRTCRSRPDCTRSQEVPDSSHHNSAVAQRFEQIETFPFVTQQAARLEEAAAARAADKAGAAEAAKRIEAQLEAEAAKAAGGPDVTNTDHEAIHLTVFGFSHSSGKPCRRFSLDTSIFSRACPLAFATDPLSC